MPKHPTELVPTAHGKKAIAWALAGAALLLTPAVALADWEPNQPVEIIISSAPGGGQDLTGRNLARTLGSHGVDAVVRNMPGAGGTTAWNYLNAHEGDGHYVAISSGRLLTSYIEGVTEIGFMHVTPLAEVLTEYAFFSVAADSDIETAGDLIGLLQDDPKALSIYNGGGLGSPSHIAVAQMARAGGVDPRELRVVSFDSGSEAMAALLGGHIDVHVATGASVAPRHQEGVIRVIGVASPTRVEGVLSDVPTFKEQGYDFSAPRSTTIFGPAGMTDEQIAFWDAKLDEVFNSETWRESAVASFRESTYLNREETLDYLNAAHSEYTEILEQLGLSN